MNDVSSFAVTPTSYEGCEEAIPEPPILVVKPPECLCGNWRQRSTRPDSNSGKINWVQIDVGKEDHDHQISSYERLWLAMVRQ